MKVGSSSMTNKHFNNPKNANLTRTPLKKIEKLVEASTCALGNQPQKGQIGNFTPKPIIKHIKRKLTSKGEKK